MGKGLVGNLFMPRHETIHMHVAIWVLCIAEFSKVLFKVLMYCTLAFRLEVWTKRLISEESTFSSAVGETVRQELAEEQNTRILHCCY